MDSYSFLDDSLDNLSTTLTFFTCMASNAYGRRSIQTFKRKLAHLYEKRQTTESFYVPLKLGREGYFYTLKQSYPDSDERTRTQAIVV